MSGVPLGPGLCVVDEGGSIVPVAKCSVKELRAEAEARQIVGAKEMKKAELASAIKVCTETVLAFGGRATMMQQPTRLVDGFAVFMCHSAMPMICT